MAVTRPRSMTLYSNRMSICSPSLQGCDASDAMFLQLGERGGAVLEGSPVLKVTHTI